LCSDGALYSCGRNDCGQLGHGDTIDKKTPLCILNCPKNIVSIACGQFHTALVTALGVVSVCGKNDYGQLGLENVGLVKSFVKVPIQVEIEGILQVVCGYYHTLVLSQNGIVAGCGRNDYGQVLFRYLLLFFFIFFIIFYYALFSWV
jgi:alpha-tubulin suppressor-like RCC1 family protein